MPGGLRLALVDALADEWGVRPGDTGKVVWCEQLLPGAGFMDDIPPLH